MGMRLLTNLMLVTLWLMTAFGAVTMVTTLLNLPSTIAVVAGVFSGVFFGWTLYTAAKIMWRIK